MQRSEHTLLLPSRDIEGAGPPAVSPATWPLFPSTGRAVGITTPGPPPRPDAHCHPTRTLLGRGLVSGTGGSGCIPSPLHATSVPQDISPPFRQAKSCTCSWEPLMITDGTLLADGHSHVGRVSRASAQGTPTLVANLGRRMSAVHLATVLVSARPDRARPMTLPGHGRDLPRWDDPG